MLQITYSNCNLKRDKKLKESFIDNISLEYLHVKSVIILNTNCLPFNPIHYKNSCFDETKIHVQSEF